LIEEIKQALNLVQKFSFVFNLPSDIRENIINKDYKKLVHDYGKSKYFKRKCKSKIFEKTFTNIAEQITQVKKDLFEQLILPDKYLSDKDMKLLIEEKGKKKFIKIF
jgi:exocyst complex component 2